MLSIEIPDSSWCEQDVSLGGYKYVFTYSKNNRDGAVRLSISDDEGEIISGLKLVEEINVLSKYTLDRFDHGKLFLVRIRKGDEFPTNGNIGVEKEFALLYLTNEELET